MRELVDVYALALPHNGEVVCTDNRMIRCSMEFSDLDWAFKFLMERSGGKDG